MFKTKDSSAFANTVSKRVIQSARAAILGKQNKCAAASSESMKLSNDPPGFDCFGNAGRECMLCSMSLWQIEEPQHHHSEANIVDVTPLSFLTSPATAITIPLETEYFVNALSTNDKSVLGTRRASVGVTTKSECFGQFAEGVDVMKSLELLYRPHSVPSPIKQRQRNQNRTKVRFLLAETLNFCLSVLICGCEAIPFALSSLSSNNPDPTQNIDTGLVNLFGRRENNHLSSYCVLMMR